MKITQRAFKAHEKIILFFKHSRTFLETVYIEFAWKVKWLFSLFHMELLSVVHEEGEHLGKGMARGRKNRSKRKEREGRKNETETNNELKKSKHKTSHRPQWLRLKQVLKRELRDSSLRTREEALKACCVAGRGNVFFSD